MTESPSCCEDEGHLRMPCLGSVGGGGFCLKLDMLVVAERSGAGGGCSGMLDAEEKGRITEDEFEEVDDPDEVDEVGPPVVVEAVGVEAEAIMSVFEGMGTRSASYFRSANGKWNAASVFVV